jgi:hypothetical protein
MSSTSSPSPRHARSCGARSRWRERWTAQRFADVVCQLRRGTLDIEPLPEVLPVEVERDTVLAVIDSGRQAGERWAAIARRLNASNLRPSRGAGFTPIQVRLLFGRQPTRMATQEAGIERTGKIRAGDATPWFVDASTILGCLVDFAMEPTHPAQDPRDGAHAKLPRGFREVPQGDQDDRRSQSPAACLSSAGDHQ